MLGGLALNQGSRPTRPRFAGLSARRCTPYSRALGGGEKKRRVAPQVPEIMLF